MALTGVEVELYQEAVQELSRTLGQDRYEAAVAQGQAMSLEEAVEYALRSLE
jgi:hypothetical protein